MTAVLRAALRAVLPRAASDAIFRIFVRRRVMRRTIEEYAPREVSHVYCGVRLRVSLQDPISEAWYDRDWLLPEISELQRRGLRPGALVFNAGLHQGVIALVLAHLVGPQGRVIAVEPEPHNLRVARRNLALNGAENIHIVDAAVADRPGTVHFEENIGGRIVDSARGTIEVSTVTIDDLAAEFGQPDVLFVDIEGAEGAALAGARRTLERGTATWFIEVHHNLGFEPAGFPAPIEVLKAFGRDRYELLVAVENDDRTHSFRPLAASVPEGRFFLIAAPLRSAAV